MKNDNFYVLHIHDSIKLINEYIKGYDKESFIIDNKTHDAVIRQLEIIGEASNKLSDKSQNIMLEIPWKDVIGMRNILIHNYFGVDLEAVWETAINDLPKMQPVIEKFLIDHQ